MSAADIWVPVLSGPNGKGWPEHEQGMRAQYVPLEDAMSVSHKTDAHFTAYSVRSIERRLAGPDVFKHTEVSMVLFVVDVDDDEAKKQKVPARESWWHDELRKLESMRDNYGGFVYRTRGGYRIVHALSEPYVIKSDADAATWKRIYLAWLDHLRNTYGIDGDRACQDWTRLYRLPHVIRDGKRQRPTTIGDVDNIEAVRYAIPPPPEQKQATTRPTAYAAIPGGFDIRDCLVSSYPGTQPKSSGGAERWDIDCPWKHEHSIDSGTRETSVFVFPSGAYEFKCLHKHCADRDHEDFRKFHDPSWIPYEERMRTTTTTQPRLDGATHSAAEPSNENTKPPSKWNIQAANDEWVTKALPPREHLLVDTRTGRGAMDKRGVWLFAGAGGVGKSYTTIALGLAVVSGGRLFRTFATSGPGRVLIVAAEDEMDDIRRRVHAVARAEGIAASAVKKLHILSIHDRVMSLVAANGGTFEASADTKSLCDELATREPYDLVIVDPYGRIAGVSVDKDNAAAAATISALAMIATAARGLVLGVTHTSLRARLATQAGMSEDSTSVRGATGQTDYARGMVQLVKDKSAIWLSLGKVNHVAQWEPVGLRRGDHGELMPLDAGELASIAEAQSSSGKAAKKEADRAKRDELDDKAAREAIAANPGLAFRKLRAIVMKARTCGKDRADDALHRCAP